VRCDHKRNTPHRLPSDLIQSRKVLLTHELQLIAPDGVGHGHHQRSIDKAESSGIRRNRAAASYRPRQQWGFSARVSTDFLSENFLECPACVLHG